MHFHITATTINDFHIFIKCHFLLYPHCFACNVSSLALINIRTWKINSCYKTISLFKCWRSTIRDGSTWNWIISFSFFSFCTIDAKVGPQRTYLRPMNYISSRHTCMKELYHLKLEWYLQSISRIILNYNDPWKAKLKFISIGRRFLFFG